MYQALSPYAISSNSDNPHTFFSPLTDKPEFGFVSRGEDDVISLVEGSPASVNLTVASANPSMVTYAWTRIGGEGEGGDQVIPQARI